MNKRIKDRSSPAIVIVAYNRPNSLRVLLNSLARSYFNSRNINLVISIDGGGPNSVKEVAENFVWEFGEKIIINYRRNLGLHKHVIFCGDLAFEYGSVIVLEDDLFVSPYFYEYACKSIGFYKPDNRVCGISLYSYNYNEHNKVPFIPIDDGNDVYFIQTASSWGQLWTCGQWKAFRAWYDKNINDKNLSWDYLPEDVAMWPSSSWKKYFINYMVDTKKYMVFPRTSLTTNSGCIGTHAKRPSVNSQVPLISGKQGYRFSKLEESISVYDCYYEICSDSMKKIAPDLTKYEFEVDLLGSKPLGKVGSPYLLTSKESISPIKSYGLELLPIELNIAYNLDGTHLSLTKTKDANSLKYNKRVRLLKLLRKDVGLREGLKLWVAEIFNRCLGFLQ